MNLINNYHTHTSRCGHAIGEDEEYVINAIKIGIKELGISDHIPFKGVVHPRVRMNYEELDDYINSITALKEKYKDQIKIYIGFEAEYYPILHDYYVELLNRVDYLICGQHFNLSNDKDFLYVVHQTNSKEAVKAYIDGVIAAMESGLFKYIAHPDIIMRAYTYRDEFIESELRRMLEVAERLHFPLEVNLEGMNRKVMMNDPLGECFYPYPSFWKLVSEYNIDVILGADVHDPKDFFRDYDKYARKIIEDNHLHLIDRIEINRR